MPSLLQINVTANWGSTGKIAEDIGKLAIQHGFDSWIAYGRGNPKSQSNLIRIGSDFDMKLHGMQTRLFDSHGLASNASTRAFIEKVKDIKPDIIHLHNIHGYYLNYPILFDYLKKWGGPVVWTLHDCWPFTGHCSFYSFANCDKWKTECNNCPQLKEYPASIWKDRSTKNYQDKKEAFLDLPNLIIVPVSNWLADEVSQSFLKEYPIEVIHNGIDLDVFRPKLAIAKDSTKKIVLGVASVWDRRKGLEDFKELRKLLPENYVIILVGLTQDQISSLPDGITGIRRTENMEQLVDLYNMADVFVNPTLEDNYPTTNLETIACGTPVLTYKTGGSPEALDSRTGIVVPYRNIQQMAEKIQLVCENHPFSSDDCRARAESLFDKNKAFQKYINLYTSLLN